MTGTGRRELALIGAGAIVVGSFLPWATVTAIFGTISRSGIDTGDGKVTALLGLVAFATGYAGQVIASRVIGLIVAAIGVYDLVDIERIAD